MKKWVKPKVVTLRQSELKKAILAFARTGACGVGWGR